MSKSRILVTGGAGFIGSHLVDSLIGEGHKVRILDNLVEQVHEGGVPGYLNKKAELQIGDICDPKSAVKALRDVDVVYHLASRVGVAQSNYQIREYVEGNVGGMATLLDVIVNKSLPIRKVIMTASMTSYGEGNYVCKTCGVVRPDLRMSKKDFYDGTWEPRCPVCSGSISPVPTDEKAVINNNSVYAFTKNAQEALLQYVGTLYNIPFVSLRLFNVYGPRQSLSNPYTGVAAIFISRLKHNAQPILYEDGLQTRDFVSVRDVVAALLAALKRESANFQVFNIGSGHATSIKDIAVTLAGLLGKDIQPNVTRELRKKDIRHCVADITKAGKLLGWVPRVSLKSGLGELIDWSAGQPSVDRVEEANKELRVHSKIG